MYCKNYSLNLKANYEKVLHQQESLHQGCFLSQNLIKRCLFIIHIFFSWLFFFKVVIYFVRYSFAKDKNILIREYQTDRYPQLQKHRPKAHRWIETRSFVTAGLHYQISCEFFTLVYQFFFYQIFHHILYLLSIFKYIKIKLMSTFLFSK